MKPHGRPKSNAGATPASGDRKARTAYANTLTEQARAQVRGGKFAEAEATLVRVVGSDPKDIEARLMLAEAQRKQGKRHDAVLTLRAVTDMDPQHALAHYRLGLVLGEAGRAAEAEFAFQDAIAANPNMAEAYLDLGNLYGSQRQTEAAEAAYRQSIAVRPGYALGHYNLGNLLRMAGRLEEAAAAYQEAVKHKPDHSEAWYNLGITHKALGRLEEAVAAYQAAIARRPQQAEACNNLGVALRALGRQDEAEEAFRRALAIRDFAMPHYNLGGVANDQARFKDAIAEYRKAIALSPDFVAPHVDLGDLLLRRDQTAEAEQVYRRLLERFPDHRKGQLAGLEGLAKVYKEQDKLPDAVECFERIQRLEPEHAEAMAGVCHAKASMCDWRGRDEEFARLMAITERQIAAGQRTAFTSFSALARPLSPAMHLAIGRSWANDTKRDMAGWARRLDFKFDRARRHDRLRIGYVSQDFRNQAMGHLTRTLFGLHDRSEFEIFGYSVWKQHDGSIYRKTIEAGCEHFIDIHAISAAEGAQRIHADEIDIMIDLMGYTAGNRMRITALHPAPIVVGFLRFPGSSGADFVDYMLTDPVVTTPADQPDYSEQLVFLPHCYQPNDWTQEVDESPITRAEFGLPDDAFVFCCFNNHYKLEPFIFDVWMRILRQVPNSVLWLMQFNQAMADNLRREAEARGISPERILFARKIGKAQHLARQKLADLFLDTRYYTSHTTGSDALWGGLPVLTCPSDTFASRVTTSLLKAAGLPELIVSDFAEFERLAVHLATHPDDLKAIRDKWAAQRTTCPLFDTKRFVRNLEQAYRLIWADWLAGTPPRQLFATE